MWTRSLVGICEGCRRQADCDVPSNEQNAEREAAWVRVPRELDELVAETGITRVGVPEWRPVGFEEGRRSAYEFAAEGYFVESKAFPTADVILLKVWEYGDPEPTWEEVAATALPSLKFEFHSTQRQQTFCEYAVDAIVSRKFTEEAGAVQFINQNVHSIPLPTHPHATDAALSDWVRRIVEAASASKSAPTEAIAPTALRSQATRWWTRTAK